MIFFLFDHGLNFFTCPLNYFLGFYFWSNFSSLLFFSEIANWYPVCQTQSSLVLFFPEQNEKIFFKMNYQLIKVERFHITTSFSLALEWNTSPFCPGAPGTTNLRPINFFLQLIFCRHHRFNLFKIEHIIFYLFFSSIVNRMLFTEYSSQGLMSEKCKRLLHWCKRLLHHLIWMIFPPCLTVYGSQCLLITFIPCPAPWDSHWQISSSLSCFLFYFIIIKFFKEWEKQNLYLGVGRKVKGIQSREVSFGKWHIKASSNVLKR